MRVWIRLCAAVIFVIFATDRSAAERTTILVDTSRGAKQPFLFAAPEHPKATAILFVGGEGVLGLSRSRPGVTSSRNFLIRIFDGFVRRGVTTSAVDVPGDMEKATLGYRVGAHQASDTAAVIAWIKAKDDAPVWLIGTSKGSFSAANAAIRIRGQVAGLILTSTVTVLRKGGRSGKSLPRGVADMDLGEVRVPVLILAHEKDACASSPPSGAELLKSRLTASPRVEIVMISGGQHPRSDPCGPLSQHGYLGVEEKALRVITEFMLQ